MEFSKELFRQKLIKKRKEMNFTQQQMADMLNLERSSYTYYETGKSCPSIETALKIARIYEVSLDWLIDPEYDISEPMC